MLGRLCLLYASEFSTPHRTFVSSSCADQAEISESWACTKVSTDFSFAYKLVRPSGFCYAFVIIILSSQICMIFTARRHG